MKLIINKKYKILKLQKNKVSNVKINKNSNSRS